MGAADQQVGGRGGPRVEHHAVTGVATSGWVGGRASARQQLVQHGHPHHHAGGHLLADDRLRRVDHLGGQLDAAVDRARVHEHLPAREAPAVDLVARGVLAQRGHEAVGHPLVLHPQRVDHVGLAEPVERELHLAAERLHVARDQRRRPADGDLGAEHVEGVDARARHARVQDVADDPDVRAVDLADPVAQRVHVEQRLRRVLVLAVAGVDHARVGPAGDQVRGADVRRADHDQVGPVGRQRLHGVLERLALLDRAAAASQVHDVGAQRLGGQLEARARARGGLPEEVEHAPAAQRGDLLDLALGDLGEGLRAVQDPLDRRAVEVLDRQQVPHARASWRVTMATSSMPSSSVTRTLTRSSRAVGRFFPT